MKQIVIKGSRLVTEDGLLAADLLLSGGKIEKISSGIDTPQHAHEIIAEGMYTMPGVIDPHAHFDLDAYNTVSSDDFYTGTRAAAAGGVTSVIDFAIPSSGQSMLDKVKEKHDSARQNSIIDYSFHAQIVDWEEKKVHQMKDVTGYGITSFKIFMPATQDWGVGDEGLYEALKISSKLRSLVMVHAENGCLARHFTNKLVAGGRTSVGYYPDARPGFIEREAVARSCMLAEEAKAPVYICHLSTASAARELKELKRKGQDIFIESCPQYLLLSDDRFQEPEGRLFVCCPPLRKKEDTYELWRAVIEDIIDVIATDHCPFNKKQKELYGNDFTKIPSGLPGIESSLPLLYTEGVVNRDVDITQIYRMMSLTPAKIFGLYPEKGTLKEGSDADLVIFNTESKSRINSADLYTNCDWSPYEGWQLEGCPEYTISRGEIIFDRGNITARRGRGKFLKRKHLQ